MGALDLATEDPAVRALVVRLKRTQGLDITTAQVFAQKSDLLRTEQRTLILVGMRSETMKILDRTGASARIGRENLFPTETAWFQAMDHALHPALAKTTNHDQHGPCPIETYLDARKST